MYSTSDLERGVFLDHDGARGEHHLPDQAAQPEVQAAGAQELRLEPPSA
jgi:hypothetical protein